MDTKTKSKPIPQFVDAVSAHLHTHNINREEARAYIEEIRTRLKRVDSPESRLFVDIIGRALSQAQHNYETAELAYWVSQIKIGWL